MIPTMTNAAKMAAKKIHWPTIRRCWPVWTLGMDDGSASSAGVARDRPPVIIEPGISGTKGVRCEYSLPTIRRTFAGMRPVV
jgi:hypothetical protein